MKNPQDNPEQQKVKTKEKKTTFDWAFVGGNPDSRFSVIDALSSVDLNSSEAAENAHSISDNNGGRIELDQDEQDVIKK